MVLGFLTATVATAAFSILFAIPRRQLLWSGLVGGLAWWSGALLEHLGLGETLATLCAAVILTVMARFLSIHRRAPVTLFLTAGIFPLVPGSRIYSVALFLLQTAFSEAGRTLVATLETAGAIAIGILLGHAVPARLLTWRRR